MHPFNSTDRQLCGCTVFQPIHLLPNPPRTLLAAELTFNTSLYVKLILIFLTFRPPACTILRGSASRLQFATVSAFRSSSTSIDAIPCISSPYASPVVMRSDRGSCKIRVGMLYFAASSASSSCVTSPDVGLGVSSKHSVEPNDTVATTRAYALPSSCGMIPSPGLYSLIKTWFGF
jgi:hypothetical protein